ncbi:MAE_28990/MAE_18760 family HEPN-like nuclease, partial [Escherichia coli]
MSLIDLRDEYEERARDIMELLSLASSIEIHTQQLDPQAHQDEIESNILRVNILKSSVHMMLYNQVENTARGCIESIYDHLQDNEVNYASLREKLQVNILHRIVSDNETGQSL